MFLKSRLTFGLRKSFTFPSISTHALSTKKQNEVQVVAYYCKFTTRNTAVGLDCPKLEHITQHFECFKECLEVPKTARGRPVADFIFT